MAVRIKKAIILYTYLILNYKFSNTVHSQLNTSYTLVIRAINMWHLKQSAIDRLK